LLKLLAVRRFAKIVILSIVLSGLGAPFSFAAGALVIGKCGAYGQAFDYPGTEAAVAHARKNCKGRCPVVVTMRRACAALSIDLTHPCESFGYAVEPRISSALNAASKKCYAFGGKECVIRAWACDARG